MGALDRELEDLYRRRQPAFHAMLSSITGDAETARDAVQDAFARALRKQGDFRGDGPLEAWVWRIALRVAIDSKGSRELAVDEMPEVAFVEPARDPTLHAAVQALPPRRRLVVFLRYFADLGYDEIASVLGLAPGTVAATLSQAHAQLGSALRPEEVTS
jgi:RNA polymerase sigma-70 factor (ECF subfamily)